MRTKSNLTNTPMLENPNGGGLSKDTMVMKPKEEPEVVSFSSFLKDKKVKYKECRKNHAAKIGAYAVDGCCEFMAAGEEGTPAAFKCAVCGCHRNFHRRVMENDCFSDGSSVSTTAKSLTPAYFDGRN